MECEEGLEDIATRVLDFDTPLDLLDSDGELPDAETPMDLLRYLENDNTLLDFEHLGCAGDCNDHSETPDKYNKYRVSERQDPFMGMRDQESSSPTAKNSLLSQMMCPLEYDHDQFQQQQKQQTQSFEAWGHRSHPIKEEKDDYIDDEEELTKSSISHLASSTYQDEEEIDLPISFLDTPSPSSQSGTATGVCILRLLIFCA